MANVERKPDLAESRSLRLFFFSAVVVAALCVSGGFLGMALKDRQLIREEMLNRSRRDFANIVLMRAWNAGYGGVYVEKKPGVVSNPWLVNPDITAVDGRVFTKKNPALMTRELSERLVRDQGYAFHITSLRPVNPGNAADPRETDALRAFERGETERSWIETIEGKPRFRYMAPLRVEPPCLACHAAQGYRVGDVRGGISVSFEVSEIERRLRRNLLVVAGLAGTTILLLIGSVAVLFWQLVRRLRDARAELQRLATTDALTELPNRRSLLQRLEEELARHRRSGAPFSCALADVDHFKRVNDLFGHPEGDRVLKQVARVLRGSLRLHDLVGRYGGEEFLVLLPATDLEAAKPAVERLRASVQAEVSAGDGEAITASFGLALWSAGEPVETLLSRVDTALYRAKELGRNRVEIAPPPDGTA